MPQLHLFRRRLSAPELVALAFCVGIACLLALSGASAFGQAATSPSTPKGEKTPLGPATQAAGEDGAAGSAPTDEGGAGGLVRTIVGLAIVIAVIYGVTWVLKQLKAREHDAVGQGLRNEATLPLGPGRSVHLVRAGNEYLLLGVAEGSVQTLRSYTEDEARAAGFAIEDAADLAPLKDRPGQPTTLVERIRDLTVRR